MLPCVLVTNSSVSNIGELSCVEHKEADTRTSAHLRCSVQQDLGSTREVLQETNKDVILNTLGSNKA